MTGDARAALAEVERRIEAERRLGGNDAAPWYVALAIVREVAAALPVPAAASEDES